MHAGEPLCESQVHETKIRGLIARIELEILVFECKIPEELLMLLSEDTNLYSIGGFLAFRIPRRLLRTRIQRGSDASYTLAIVGLAL